MNGHFIFGQGMRKYSDAESLRKTLESLPIVASVDANPQYIKSLLSDLTDAERGSFHHNQESEVHFEVFPDIDSSNVYNICPIPTSWYKEVSTYEFSSLKEFNRLEAWSDGSIDLSYQGINFSLHKTHLAIKNALASWEIQKDLILGATKPFTNS